MDLTEKKKASFFRLWVHQFYMANCEEHDVFNEPKLTMSQYWQMYKWFVRSKFRDQQLKVRNNG